jgi:hypothetical protein
MARVLQAWDEHLAHPSLPRTLGAQLRSVGFDDILMVGHAFATAALDPDSYAARVFHFITQFVTGRCGLTADDVAAWVAEQRQLDQRGEFFFACVQFCFSATSARAEHDSVRVVNGCGTHPAVGQRTYWWNQLMVAIQAPSAWVALYRGPVSL